jgi:hypothetical protein
MAKLLQLKEQAASQAQQSGQSITFTAEKLIREGFMFDARVTVIFYVMSCVFVYVMARLRVVNQKFALAEIFGIIIMDLFLLFGPTLPSWDWRVARLLVEPGAIGLGLGFACCLLLFPQSTSYAVLTRMEKLVLMGESSLQCTQDRLASQPTELVQMKSAKAKAIELFKAIQPMMAFLPLDFSRCRWGVDDIRSLSAPLRRAMLAQIALLDFHIARQRAVEKFREMESQSDHQSGVAATKNLPHTIGHRQLRDGTDMMGALHAPEMGDLRSHTVEALRQSTTEVLQVCSEATKTIADCINIVNTRRWLRRHPAEKFSKMISREGRRS